MTILNKLKLLIVLLLLSSFHLLAQNSNKIILSETNIQVKNNKLITEKSYVIEILDKQSDWISDISIYYDKNDDFELLEAIILNGEGKKIRKLSSSEITTRSDISYGTFFEDGMIKEFSLKWNEYPYRIRYSYRKTVDKFLFVAGWLPSLYKNVSTEKAVLTVKIPKDYEVAMDYPADFNYTKKQIGNELIHQWWVEDFENPVKESLSAPYRELLPKVMIVPKSFEYGVKGRTDDWASYGKWQENLNAGLGTLPASEKLVVDKLLTGITDQKEIIKTLYNYMQDHTRYINVAIDIGGMKPFPASYVCEKKYGDCKALTNYMKALLNYVNIPSFYTKIYSGDNPVRVNKELPGQQFNHVILCVPVEGDTLWLENTSSTAPFNFLGAFTQGRYGLLVDGDNSRLVKTPDIKMGDILEKNTYVFSLNKNGDGEVSSTKFLIGEPFTSYRYAYSELNTKDQRKVIDNGVDLDNFTLEKYSFDLPDRNEPEITINFNGQVKNQIRKVGGLLAINLISFGVYDLEKPEDRETSFRINYPVNIEDSMVYNLPFIKEYKPELPKDIHLENQFGKYEVTFELQNDQILVKRIFHLFAGDHQVSKYEAFYEFFQSIKKYQKKSVVVLSPL